MAEREEERDTRTLAPSEGCLAIVRDEARQLSDADQTPVEIGTLVANKYRAGAIIASGGMGTIVACTDEMLGRPVALKFLKPKWCARQEVVERFLREARSAALIRSEHVVQVYDVGKTDSGIPYMVMEQLEGDDLQSVHLARAPLPIEEAVDMCLQALDAIADAHDHGIVHRDLKPSNLFLAHRRGKPPAIKVLDFGISKIMPKEDESFHITRTDSMMGSPGYMSPEQVRSNKHVDRRTDLWSLGVILYELLSGETAFTGETIGEVFTKIREEDLPLLREVRSDAPVELEAVLRRCLARRREDRFESASELRRALLPFASERMRAAYPSRGLDVSIPSDVTDHRKARRLGVAVIAAVAALAWIGWRTLAPPSASPAAEIVPLADRVVPPPASRPAPPPNPSATSSANEIAPRPAPRPASPKTPRRPPLAI